MPRLAVGPCVLGALAAEVLASVRAKLTPRDKDELIHAIRRELRAYAAYCYIEPIHLDKSATVGDLIAFVRSHHQPIP